MTTYELLCETNSGLIEGRKFSDADGHGIVDALLSGIDSLETAGGFYAKTRVSKENTHMYPQFYIPPHRGGKKHRLLTGYMPTTHILSANHYELEILRLLALWGSERKQGVEMVDRTVERLDATCFGHFCAKGECLGTSAVALRFLNAVRPDSKDWIEELLIPLGDAFTGSDSQNKPPRNLPVFYVCLTLSEIQSDVVVEMVRKRSDYLLGLLRRGWLTGPAELDTYNVLRKYVVRNTLARLPEYEHIRNSQVYISDEDGRCYCDV